MLANQGETMLGLWCQRQVQSASTMYSAGTAATGKSGCGPLRVLYRKQRQGTCAMANSSEKAHWKRLRKLARQTKGRAMRAV
jgi:hypothetical protein